MSILLRVPHGFFRRHLSVMERVLVAAGLALLLYQLMTSLPAYPSPWEVVVAVTVFFVMLWSPAVAYFLAIIAALYPLYTLSLYLAVLFLAVALLGQRIFIHNMGATLLVLLTPWLAQYHLEWVVVLLGGLWWGKAGGAWMAGMASLWGQLLFGMAGQPSNWLDVMGFQPAAEGVMANFHDANSLETLKQIVTPLATNPTQLLYHLLQIVLWAMVAGLIGRLAETGWAQQKHPWRNIAGAIFGAAGLALLNMGLATWLEEYNTSDFTWIFPGMMESALYASIVAVLLEAVRDFIEHPLPVWGLARARAGAAFSADAPSPAHPSLASRLWARVSTARLRSKPASAQPDLLEETRTVGDTPVGEAPVGGTPVLGTYQPLPVPPNLPHRDSQKKHPDDIIKIELD